MTQAIGKIYKACFAAVLLKIPIAGFGATSLPKLSLLVRTDIFYEAREEKLESEASVAEVFDLNLNDARFSFTGQIENVFSYYLDLDLLKFHQQSLGSPLPPREKSGGDLKSQRYSSRSNDFLSEIWTERLVLPFSFKAGRFFVRSGAFSNDRAPSDTYVTSLFAALTPVHTLTGFEFGLLSSNTQLHLQVFETTDPNLQLRPKTASYASSLTGEYFEGLLSGVLSVSGFSVGSLEQRDTEIELENEASFIYQFGAGIQARFASTSISFEYGRMHREAAANNFLETERVLMNSELLPDFTAAKIFSKAQNITFRAEYEFEKLRPLLDLCFDHFESGKILLGRSYCAATGVEYFPQGPQYRTHLVFTAKQETFGNQKAVQWRGVNFGVRFLL